MVKPIPTGCSMLDTDQTTYTVGEPIVVHTAYGTYVLGEVCVQLQTGDGYYDVINNRYHKVIGELENGYADGEVAEAVAKSKGFTGYKIVTAEVVPLVHGKRPNYTYELIENENNKEDGIC